MIAVKKLLLPICCYLQKCVRGADAIETTRVLLAMKEIVTYYAAENQLYLDVKTIIEDARANAVRSVDYNRVLMYWKTGRRVFENYIKTIRILRNTCAHGGILFDLKLPQSVKNGPAGHFPRLSSNNLSCTLQIVDFFIRTISINRQNEMRSLIYNARSKLYKQNILLEDTLKKTAGVLQYQK